MLPLGEYYLCAKRKEINAIITAKENIVRKTCMSVKAQLLSTIRRQVSKAYLLC